nr:MAG TPA: hypothetical protein [Caudoviricetes sp.]
MLHKRTSRLLEQTAHKLAERRCWEQHFSECLMSHLLPQVAHLNKG